jgi:hypothetical protein
MSVIFVLLSSRPRNLLSYLVFYLLVLCLFLFFHFIFFFPFLSLTITLTAPKEGNEAARKKKSSNVSKIPAFNLFHFHQVIQDYKINEIKNEIQETKMRY